MPQKSLKIGRNNINLNPGRYICTGGDVQRFIREALNDKKVPFLEICTSVFSEYATKGNPLFDGYRELFEKTHGFEREGEYTVIKAENWGDYTYYVTLLRGPCEKEEEKFDWSAEAEKNGDPLDTFMRGTFETKMFDYGHDFAAVFREWAKMTYYDQAFGYQGSLSYNEELVKRLQESPLPKMNSLEAAAKCREFNRCLGTLWEDNSARRFGIV